MKVALAVLNAVKSKFPETNEFIDGTLKEECEKEKITADEVIKSFVSGNLLLTASKTAKATFNDFFQF